MSKLAAAASAIALTGLPANAYPWMAQTAAPTSSQRVQPDAAEAATVRREQSDAWIPVEMLEATDAGKRRDLMLDRIRTEIAARRSTLGVGDVERILEAMRGLDRERFVPPEQRRSVYLPLSVDIGEGQTLSDAYLVTVMIAAAGVRPGTRVLDVGTGSGFQAALLVRLGAKVVTVEILPSLAKRAAALLADLGFHDVAAVTGDGAAGWPAAAPFDAIVVAAGATAFPPSLVAQLAPGGRLVMPIGPAQMEEQLLVLTKGADGRIDVCTLGLAAAVPLTGPAAAAPGRTAPGAMRYCYGRSVT